VLGISPEAVRNRLSRGSLQRVKEGGTVYVLIDRDMARPIDDMSSDISGELIDTLKEQNAYLRDQLQQERDANRENRRIIAALTSRIPELEAPADRPPEATRAPTGGAEEAARGEVPPEPQGAAQPRPWWRRVFGG
jgi:gas vesicle protein